MERHMPAVRRNGGKRNKKTAFVLAGGGSLGAVQVGMLKALLAHNVNPDLIIGASVGAINGAYAAGEIGVAGTERLQRIWMSMRRPKIFPFSPLQALLGLLGFSDHLVSSGPLRRVIEAELPFQLIEDAEIPCIIIATDVLTGEMVSLKSGPAVEALLASSAIPAVFPPQTIDERVLIDGGVSNNTPIAAAVDAGSDRIIVLPTGMACAATEPPHATLGMVLETVNLLVMRQLVDDIYRFSAEAEIITIPPLCPMRVTPYDFSQTADLIERAHASTKKWLKDHGLHPNNAPAELLPHTH
jgi:NTE family protein